MSPHIRELITLVAKCPNPDARVLLSYARFFFLGFAAAVLLVRFANQREGSGSSLTLCTVWVNSG